MLLVPLVSGSSAGQVKVPDGATFRTQLAVLLVDQLVNATSIELSDVQPSNMPL